MNNSIPSQEMRRLACETDSQQINRAGKMDELSNYLTITAETINKHGGSDYLYHYNNDREWEAELRSLLSGSPIEVIQKVIAIVVQVREDALDREWTNRDLACD